MINKRKRYLDVKQYMKISKITEVKNCELVKKYLIELIELIKSYPIQLFLVQ